MNLILSMLFGCWHLNYSFPRSDAKANETYVVCLDCGKEFLYDWRGMKVLGEREIREVPRERAPEPTAAPECVLVDYEQILEAAEANVRRRRFRVVNGIQ